ncbi:hypothetical protein [Maricaulis sp.]|uniref:hypothetical protein n=1 Tax=Maricaulis sp. TaxID=1486257 RepID=UPI001B09A8AF|nr:hypothetical protein [Maricaulis sp.]MBO6796718.1 hypothetical protein [Maricaulis sp.]
MFVRFLFAISMLMLAGCASTTVPTESSLAGLTNSSSPIDVPEIAILPLRLQVSDDSWGEVGAVRIAGRTRYVLLLPSRQLGRAGSSVDEHWIGAQAEAAHVYLGDLDGDGVREILIQETRGSFSTSRLLGGQLTSDEQWPLFWHIEMFGDEVAERVIPDMEFLTTLRADAFATDE